MLYREGLDKTVMHSSPALQSTCAWLRRVEARHDEIVGELAQGHAARGREVAHEATSFLGDLRTK